MKIPFLSWLRNRTNREPVSVAPPRHHGASYARAYEAAITTNLNLDFVPTYGSANAEVLTSVYQAKGRCRTLVKDFSTARGIVRNFKNNVVGCDPFPLEMKIGTWSADGKTFTLNTKECQLVEDAWKEAATPKNCTVRGTMSRMEICQLVEASMIRDGSGILRHHRAFQGNKFGYAVEAIDSDRLQENYMGRSKEGNAIRFSIEFDKWNRPLAYWILTRHPGDLFQYNNVQEANTWRERVPAEDIMHVNNLRDRAEQDLGMPEFDSIVQPLHMQRQFDRAHTTSAIVAASNLGFIEKDLPTGMQTNGDPGPYYNGISPTGNGQTPGNGQGGGSDKINAVEPGTYRRLEFGEKAKNLRPEFPVESASGFKRDNMHDVANGVGQSFAAVSSDYEKLSFSVAKSSEIPQKDNYVIRQEHHKDQYYRDWFNAWLEYALLTQAIPLPYSRLEEFQKAAHFGGKTWPSIQPKDDMETDIMGIEAGLISPQQVAARRGVSVEMIYQEIAEAKKIAESHDLDFSAQDPTLPTMKKGEPLETAPKAGEDESSETKT